MCSKSPDTSGMNAAALQSAKISQEALDWYKAKDIEEKPMRDKQAAVALATSQQQLESAKKNDALSDEYANYNRTTFRPLEQKIVADAQGYDTPEKRQAAADAAMADTNMAFEKTRDATARSLAANGINPGSTRAMAVQSGDSVNQAVANAGAAYKARKGVESVGHAMEMDAASLGRGLSSSQATSAQVAIQAGNSGVSNAGVPLQTGVSRGQQMGTGFSTAIQGQQVAGNLYGQAAQLSNQDNGAWGALGGIAGQFAGSKAGSAAIESWLPSAAAVSDENMKTDIKPVSDEEALTATAATPVKKWKYDPAKMAAAGIDIPQDAEGENIGPMAQDVQKTMGDGAAPGGKALNLITMNGMNMQAVKAVNNKVDKLGKEVKSLAAMIRTGHLQAGAAA